MAASWECPALPMISLPLKESSKTNFQPLKPLIGAAYGENPDSFSDEIKQLEQLRENCLKPSRDFHGCNVLRRYYAQLHLLKARFDDEALNRTQLHFSWKDAFSNADYKQEGLQIEMSSLLYNIGALHSQVGSKEGRYSEQDMKESLTHFQCAAGAFQYFYDNHGSSGCGDMSPQLIEMYKNLMLAQAQECTVEKSLKGMSRVKNLNISKISMKVAQYYQSVLQVLESGAGAAILKKHKEWTKFLQIKATLYTAVAHLYQANSLEEQGNYGYMIAFQQLSLQKIQSVGKFPRGTPDVFKDAVKNFTEYISLKLQESLNQNEQVFHELVPGLETLEPAPGVELVKALVFQPVDRKTSGSDIFSRLVPMSAYEAASVYSEEKAKILRSLASSVEEKNEELEGFISSLNMEEIDQAKAEAPSLPVELLEQHHFLQRKHQAIRDIESKIKDLKKLSERVEEQLNVVAQKKLTDEEEESGYQERHGPRPESQICTGLWRELQSLSKYHQQASKSNNELFNTFEKHRPNLLLLASHTDTLSSAIPRMNLKEAAGDFNEERWKELLGKVEGMKQQRAQLMRQLREQIGSDDITRVIIGESSSNQDSVFEEHLQKHRDSADIIRQNLSAQDNILRALTEANAKQAQLRQSYHKMIKRREDWCISLAKSAGHYNFLESKISEGLEFYAKLAESVSRLHKRSLEVCASRHRDRLAVERRTATPTFDKKPPSPAPPPSNIGPNSQGHTFQPHPQPPEDNASKLTGSQGDDLHSSLVAPEGEGVMEKEADQEKVKEMIMKMKQTQDEQISSLNAPPTNIKDVTSPNVGDSNLLMVNGPSSEGTSLPLPLMPEEPTRLSSVTPPIDPVVSSQSTSDRTLPTGPVPETETETGDVGNPTTDRTGQVPIPQGSNMIQHSLTSLSQIAPSRPDKPAHLVGVPTGTDKTETERTLVPQGNEADNSFAATLVPFSLPPNSQSSANMGMIQHSPSITPDNAPLDQTTPTETTISDNDTVSALADSSQLSTGEETVNSTNDNVNATPTSINKQFISESSQSMSNLPNRPSGIMTTPSSLSRPSSVAPSSLPPSMPYLPTPPLSVTTMVRNPSPMGMGVASEQLPLSSSSATSSHLENILVRQQETIQKQTIQLDEQKEQLKSQTVVIEELRKEMERLRIQQSIQDKEKTASSSNQAMLMKLLQQQQGLFTQQQSQMDKISKEGEARRQQNTDTEMRLRDALAQEQFQNQSLQSQLTQQRKDVEHLHQQLHSANQQLQAVQSQAQQYLGQIQERDKALANYRDEHRRIVEEMEGQFKQRIQQLTQQIQELQAEFKRGVGSMIPSSQMGPPPHGLQVPLKPQQLASQPPAIQQTTPTSNSSYQPHVKGHAQQTQERMPYNHPMSSPVGVVQPGEASNTREPFRPSGGMTEMSRQVTPGTQPPPRSHSNQVSQGPSFQPPTTPTSVPLSHYPSPVGQNPPPSQQMFQQQQHHHPGGGGGANQTLPPHQAKVPQSDPGTPVVAPPGSVSGPYVVSQPQPMPSGTHTLPPRSHGGPQVPHPGSGMNTFPRPHTSPGNNARPGLNTVPVGGPGSNAISTRPFLPSNQQQQQQPVWQGRQQQQPHPLGYQPQPHPIHQGGVPGQYLSHTSNPSVNTMPKQM